MDWIRYYISLLDEGERAKEQSKQPTGKIKALLNDGAVEVFVDEQQVYVHSVNPGVDLIENVEAALTKTVEKYTEQAQHCLKIVRAVSNR
jgi:hypothetical protein